MYSEVDEFYRIQFENRFQRLTREEFQGWFVDIMAFAFPGDFVATRQGTHKGGGDLGCDGFRKSTGTVYAVFAPRKCSPTELHGKIDGDFKTALTNFGDRMKEWVFVHNEPDERLSSETVLVLADLQKQHLPIRISDHIGKRELWEIVRTLEPRILNTWFSAPPSPSQIDRLTMEDLRPVLRFIEQQPIPVEVPTEAPNQNKLEHNRLSPVIADFLRLGRRRERLVEQYIEGCSDVVMGEAIAQAFRVRYQRMRSSRWEPDQIFDELLRFAGGNHFQTPTQQAAVWAVLSYYFERCDIFENSPEVVA